jgi:hypothetical protein
MHRNQEKSAIHPDSVDTNTALDVCREIGKMTIKIN